MTEAAFIEWSGTEGIRAEWVDGEVEIMNPALSNHAKLTMFLILLIGGYVSLNDLGEVWTEPFEVRLPKQRRRRSPDLFYAAKQRLHLLQETQFNGAPDLIVEVISADSQTRDRREKFNEYESAGVLEYWLPDPLSRSFEAYARNSKGKFEAIPLTNGIMHSTVLKGLYFRKEWVWQFKFPQAVTLAQQMSAQARKPASTRRPRSSDKHP
jgi:Uma2 family endonuclease